MARRTGLNQWRLALMAGVVTLLPALAFAQGSITGVVRDSSGAVLPGVTVEAASPALIEKVRTVVSDSSGQYQIVDLRPGTYTLTLTLSGFNTFRREGIELTGNFTATVNAEMRVGALEETITVTAESPVVDVSNAARQRVVRQDLFDALPNDRVPGYMAGLMPGITNTGTQEVGGSQGNSATGGPGMVSHGSRSTDIRTMASNVSIGSPENGASGQGVPNLMMYQEVTIDTAGASAENDLGGVTLNLIPRDGGNTFRGSVIFAFANSSMQGTNLTQELNDRGLKTANTVKRIYDINPGFGGPIKRDNLWFFTTFRDTSADNTIGGMFFNKNAGNPNAYTYEPDTSRPAFTTNPWKTASVRLTWQATRKNKLAFGYNQVEATRPPVITATAAPESVQVQRFRHDITFLGEWTAPLTNRVLLESVVYQRRLPSYSGRPEDLPALGLSKITEQATGVSFRALSGTNDYKVNTNIAYRVAASYVTGTHAFKAGYADMQGFRKATALVLDSPVAFRVNNGVPNQLTEFYGPNIACDNKRGCDRWQDLSHLDHDMGIYASDKWTIDRLTLNYGVRYSWFKTTFPAQHVEPGILAPTLNLDFPETAGVNWKDIVPRLGAAYNVFGTGKTALKISLNKYVAGQALAGNVTFGDLLNPFRRLVLSTTRNWTDSNNNFVPDCDLTNPAAQNLTATGGDICAAMANQNFGKTVAGTTYDPETTTGWGKRAYNWEFSTGIQHEILSRTSVEVAYFRRSFGNFIVTDNRSVAASDYTSYQITAPVDPRLPGGGGYAVTGLYDLNPNKVGQVDNYITFAGDGTQSESWNGVDITASTRLVGAQFQGGVSTGRRTTDVCGMVAQLPEMLTAPEQFCLSQEPFLTQVKFIGTYTVPKIDVRFSGSFQNIPGPQLSANYVASNAVITPSLGRSLSGGAANATVNILEPGAIYGDRVNQVDLRFSKILRIGSARRVTVNFDVANALNANPVLTESSVFATWRQPQSILTARFVKFGLQLDF
jgi:hypothetical protein